MTSISLSGASSMTAVMQQVGGPRPPGPPPGGGPLKAAAEALDMSQDDLVAALQDGRSLADVADEQGVALDDLTAALKADMPPELAASGKADEVVSNIITTTGLPQGSPPPPGGGRGFAASRLDGSTSGVLGSSLTAGQQSALESLSSLLGTDSESLLANLRGGTSLTDLVSRQGVSSSALASVLEDGLMVDTRA
jgi:lambda repressor-like predicted transcriptional regulator